MCHTRVSRSHLSSAALEPNLRKTDTQTLQMEELVSKQRKYVAKSSESGKDIEHVQYKE